MELNAFPVVISRPFNDCPKLHMMALFPDGAISGREDLCDCKSCIIGKFSKCKIQTNAPLDERTMVSQEKMIR